jgi:hypothetical protein
MKYAKKFRVVPYNINSLEKSTESYVDNFSNNMTNTIHDKSIAPDNKMKIYRQNLNKFLLKYDPESYGVAPTLNKLVKVVTEFLESNKEPNLIEDDLKPLFKDIKDSYSADVSYLNSPEIKNYKKAYDFNKDYYKLGSNDNSINTSNIQLPATNYQAEAIKNLASFNSDFEPLTNPSDNTRYKAPKATHSEGLELNKNYFKPTKNLLRTVEKPLPSPKFNEKSSISTNKFKNAGKQASSSSKQQSGNNILEQNGGCIWLTKRFF